MNSINIIATDKAARPNGHYSQAIEANGFIFTSVQLGITNNTTDNQTISQQLLSALNSTEQILLSAGSSLRKVVKLTIYLSDIANWPQIDVVVADVFGEHKPARGVIPVKELHLGAKVAIDVIAVK